MLTKAKGNDPNHRPANVDWSIYAPDHTLEEVVVHGVVIAAVVYGSQGAVSLE